MVSADLEGLVSAHNQTGLLVLLVLEQSDVSGTTLLPLLAIAIESEELRTHLEHLLLEFFVGLGFHLLGQADDGFEVDFRGLGGLILAVYPLVTPKRMYSAHFCLLCGIQAPI